MAALVAGSTGSTGVSTCSSTTSSAATGTWSGTSRCGSTTWHRRPADAANGRAHPPDHRRAAIPLMLRGARARQGGLVVEMTDGTSQSNAEFRRNVGFYYDLVKANVERIMKGLTAELENCGHGGRGDAGLAPLGNGCWKSSASPRPTGATRWPRPQVSRSPSRPPTWPGASPRSPGRARPYAGQVPIISSAPRHAYDITDTDGSRPDCWCYVAAYGWERDDGTGIDDFR